MEILDIMGDDLVLKRTKRIITIMITTAMVLTANIGVSAASNDGWTEANKTTAASNGAWDSWCKEWETIKNNPTEMSLTPGKDAKQLNFAWYSKSTDNKPGLKYGKKADLSDAKGVSVTHENAVNRYISNKATITNLEEKTTYYYSYQVNGVWSKATPYTTKSTDNFSFLFVGDPQIGSSSGNKATGSDKEQGQDNAVRNDSFNWNNTINSALKANQNVSFMISAGDQIQSSDKKNPGITYDKNEIEYAGYLSPKALLSLPVATTIGNHDAPSGNYSFHFNNPNVSELGKTEAGGDYYYSYGNSLFITLNTNNKNVAEHKQLIEKAISENKNAKWRIVTLHQDIYGSGEHSNEPEIVNLRYSIVPILEANDIDVVLTGHDHTYTRSLILKGAVKDASKLITEEEYDNYIDGKTPIDSKYNNYLASIQDSKAIENTSGKDNVINPNGILYMTADSATGSKFYDLTAEKQAYVASRYQEDMPTYSIVDINDKTFTINTYRSDNGAKIDNSFTITKTK
jgi:Predicted phosphohydrolases